MNFNHRPWLLLALLTPLAAQALESDAKEPIYVDSDTALTTTRKGSPSTPATSIPCKARWSRIATR